MVFACIRGMTKFRKVKVPAHREFFLTLVRPLGERCQWYNGTGYSSHGLAQRDADRMNAVRKSGQIIVEFKDYPESIDWQGTL